MDLQNKHLWDLSLDEIEYVYRHRHMNHYIYAGLKTYYTSTPPLHRSVSLRPNTIPSFLCGPVEGLLRLSPFLGQKEPAAIRAAVTYVTHLLYLQLEQVSLQDISRVAQLLAACAYLSLHSEKNDNLPLWSGPVVREITEYTKAFMERLLKPNIDMEAVYAMESCLAGVTEDKRPGEKGYVAYGDISMVYWFIPKAMRTIIAYMENGESPQLIERALLNTEQAMMVYEENNTAALPPFYSETRRVRYHNTLYLYGAMFYQRQGWHERAVDWYLKQINVPGLPYLFGNFQTDLKTTERLVAAYPLVGDKEKQRDLEDLIHRCMVRICLHAAEHGRRIKAYWELHPATDMRTVSLRDTQKNLPYSGEASRELYLFALLYNKFVQGVDYRDIDYAMFFQY